MMRGVRFILRALAWIALVPYLMVLVVVVTGPPTWSAAAYIAALGILLAGLITLPNPKYKSDDKGRPRGVSRTAFGATLIITVVRAFTADTGESLRLETPGSKTPWEPRFVDRVVDESDLTVSGARILVSAGVIYDDADELPDAMRAGYTRMHDSEGDSPSPFLATSLGLQRASSFGVVFIEPRRKKDGAERTTGILFLHGDSGNLALPCWQVAQAVSDLEVLTACPSTRLSGDWSSAEGEAIVRRAIDLLRQRGISRIVLMGVSTGSVGASRLVSRMQGTFDALVLVSGVAADAGAPGVPTLVMHGSRDTHASATTARQYALRHRGTYFPLRAGHFAMVVRPEEHDKMLHEFISDRVRTTTRRAER